jgi:hypothetical protein
LAQVVVLVLAVMILLPIAFGSMTVQLTDRQERNFYDFPSGQRITPDSTPTAAGAESHFNIAAIDLDEAEGNITLAISGHRVCPTECPTIDFTLFSLDDNADVRRALPPSTPFSLGPHDLIFTKTVQLPVRGQPSQYPFDDYILWLGLSGAAREDGTTTPLTPELLQSRAVITTQNQLRDFTMTDPLPIDPARVKSVTDPFDFLGVQELHFSRPVHLEILTTLLIILISVSAIMAVAVRDMSDLIIGIGSLILGIWGVRSVLVPTPLPVVTSVDLSLSVIILFVLLGLLVRAARHLHHQSELPPLSEWWRKKS